MRYYAAVTKVEIVTRAELFPEETNSSRSEQTYHKISFGPLRELVQPVVSYRARRLLFVPTTWAKFSQATEVNDLFHESPLEDVFWHELRRQNLPAERQVLLQTNGKNWVCDFVFYCAKGNVDVECDGDTYHMSPEAASGLGAEAEGALHASAVAKVVDRAWHTSSRSSRAWRFSGSSGRKESWRGLGMLSGSKLSLTIFSKEIIQKHF